MKTFVGIISTFVMSGVMGLLIYITFRDGASVEPPQPSTGERAPEPDGRPENSNLSRPTRHSHVGEASRANES